MTSIAAKAAAGAFAAPIAAQIWDMKYRFPGAPDASISADDTVEATWRRVAGAVAEAEPLEARAAWRARFYEALEDFKFLPAGRILAGAGAGRSVTLFNCFVMGRIEDSMAGVFDALKEAALTMQQGGGVGFDFSTIRPKGAPVAGVGADASGPLSFMDVWDAMCRTIMSAGSRRGAMMATLRCDHPDIEAFIAAKGDSARLRMFNLSVLASDAFMAAVDADAPWPLTFGGRVYKTVSARALWDQIMRATYEYAEPGVIFIDRVNAENNLQYCETISATNPCGEQPLPPYGACLLGSINLARLVEHPFSPAARIEEAGLAALVETAVRMMDDVIDVSRYPLAEQEREAKAKRRIGLGVTGLADALLMVGLTYGEDAAAAQSADWLRQIRDAAYQASADLAREKGAFPLYDADAYLARPMIARLPDDVRAQIRAHGIRNALLTSIAPTGTISLFAGNVSSGVEPVFAYGYTRKVLQPDGSALEEEVTDYAVQRYRTLFGPEAALPAHFVSAQTLSPEAHVRMQAAAQPFVDSAISKTINVPEHIGFEDFKSVYALAYASGCKGCTTYRPNAVTGSVLSAADAPQPDEESRGAPLASPMARPETLIGATYKLRWPGSAHALYITVNDIETGDGARRPFEVFINSKNMEHYAWTVALTRMISAVFRRGGDVGFVVEELKAVFDPRGGAWLQGRYVPSILAAIGGVIERHMVETGFLPPNGAGLAAPEGEATAHQVEPVANPAFAPERGGHGAPCPNCGSFNVRMVEGCATCADCGHSECS